MDTNKLILEIFKINQRLDAIPYLGDYNIILARDKDGMMKYRAAFIDKGNVVGERVDNPEDRIIVPLMDMGEWALMTYKHCLIDWVWRHSAEEDYKKFIESLEL